MTNRQPPAPRSALKSAESGANCFSPQLFMAAPLARFRANRAIAFRLKIAALPAFFRLQRTSRKDYTLGGTLLWVGRTENMRKQIWVPIYWIAFFLFSTAIAPADTCTAQGKTCLIADAAGCSITCPNTCKVTGAKCTLGIGTDAVCECTGGGAAADTVAASHSVAVVPTSVGSDLFPSALVIALALVAMGLIRWRRSIIKPA